MLGDWQRDSKGVKGSIFSFLVSRVIMKEWEGISKEKVHTYFLMREEVNADNLIDDL